ncbi:glycosyl transferase, partial [Lysobacteraceae bacterium NML71-0210]
MEFTGERYMPAIGGEIRLEHLHRYGWCLNAVAGKNVLDIACGEGYGSALLAGRASWVAGVDISEEALNHARKKYFKIGNLEFFSGDAAGIPFPDNTFDVVVSFETIEHHDKHREMIAEIRRVLKPDGFLIISSPNKEIYSDASGHHNEFHVKELYFDELDGLLRCGFGVVEYFGQRISVGSSIVSLHKGDGKAALQSLVDDGDGVAERAPILVNPVYFIAVASAERKFLPGMPASMLHSESEDLYERHVEVARWAQGLDIEFHEMREKYGSLVAEHEGAVAWAQGLDKELEGLRDIYNQATSERDGAQRLVQKLSSELNELEAAHDKKISERDAAQSQVQQLTDDLGALKAEHSQTVSERDAAQSQVQQLADDLGVLKAEHSQTVSERDAAQSQ